MKSVSLFKKVVRRKTRVERWAYYNEWKNESTNKMDDNMSAAFFDVFTKKEPFIVQFGAELIKTNSTQLLFEMEGLDKNIFQNYLKSLPEDKHKVFTIKLEYESD